MKKLTHTFIIGLLSLSTTICLANEMLTCDSLVGDDIWEGKLSEHSSKHSSRVVTIWLQITHEFDKKPPYVGIAMKKGEDTRFTDIRMINRECKKNDDGSLSLVMSDKATYKDNYINSRLTATVTDNNTIKVKQFEFNSKHHDREIHIKGSATLNRSSKTKLKVKN